MKKLSLLLFILLILVGCGSQMKSEEGLDRVDIKYASKFRISLGDGYKVVEMVNPWDTTAILYKYVLVSKDRELPKNLPSGILVRTPIEKIVVYTVVDASIIDFLGEVDKIVGICEVEYFRNENIQRAVKNNKIIDLGQATMPSVEKMVALQPEAIVATSFQNSGYGVVEKMGIPIIACASYMEGEQLGQSEWIKYFGAFLEKEQLADSLFDAIEERYLEAKEIAKDAKDIPLFLAGKKFGSSWYIPAGDSYKSKMFRDAAMHHHWMDAKGEGSIGYSFEEVFSKARHADFWMISYNEPKGDITYKSLKDEYIHYADFDAYKNRRIYGCNTASVPFYEESILMPDLVLKDYIKIAHPELMKDYEPRYFKPIE